MIFIDFFISCDAIRFSRLLKLLNSNIEEVDDENRSASTAGFPVNPKSYDSIIRRRSSSGGLRDKERDSRSQQLENKNANMEVKVQEAKLSGSDYLLLIVFLIFS